MSQLTEAMVTIFVAIVGVAILSVLVSSRSQTPQVLQAFGSMFSNALGVATAPVSGSSVNIDTSYPAAGGMGGFGNTSPFGYSGF
jgi:hypothetical protein